jgi:hypothetical protein
LLALENFVRGTRPFPAHREDHSKVRHNGYHYRKAQHSVADENHCIVETVSASRMTWVLMVFHAFESAPYIFLLLIAMRIGRFVKVLTFGARPEKREPD